MREVKLETFEEVLEDAKNNGMQLTEEGRKRTLELLKELAKDNPRFAVLFPKDEDGSN